MSEEKNNLFKEDEEQQGNNGNNQKQKLFGDKKWNITMGSIFAVVIIAIVGVAIWVNM